MSGSRFRSRGGFSPVVCSNTSKTCAGDTTSTTAVVAQIGEYETMTDFVTSDFRRRQTLGSVVANPMKMQHDQRTHSMGACGHKHLCENGPSYETYDFSNIGVFVGQTSCKRLISLEEVDAMVSVVSTSAAARVASPTVQSLVSIGELRETLNMLRHPFENLNKFLSGVKRSRRYKSAVARRKQQGLTLAEFLQNEWMRYRYGIRPFVGEIKAWNDALNRSSTLSEMTERFTARSGDNVSLNQTEAYDITVGGTYNFTGSVTYTHSVKVRAGILYDWNAFSQDLETITGFRLVDVPAAAWELVTLSFVVDWFVNVGDFISAMTPKPGVRRLAEWYTVEENLTASRYVNAPTLTSSAISNGWILTAANGGTDTHTQRIKKRICTLPITLSYKPFALTKVTSDARVIDLVAITRNLLHKRDRASL